MENKVVSQKRNVAIELWRFLIAFAIIGFHTGWIIAMSCDGSLGYWMQKSNWFFGSSEVLLIFTVTAGYFMAAHFQKRKADPAYMARSASSRAWEYTWARVKSLLPVLILGYVLGVVISTGFFYQDYTLQQVLAMVVNSAWEFLGFHAAGFRSTGNQFFNLNGTLWFISAMIIVGYFMYWAMCKNEDAFCGLFAPLTFIFLGGWWCFTGTRAAQTAWSTFGAQTASTNGMGGSATDTTATLGFNNGLLFVMLGMLGGVMVYFLVKKASEHEFTALGKALLTVLNAACSALLLWYTIYQPTYFMLDRWTVSLLCIAVVTLALMNKDALTMALNNRVTSKLFAYLGSISLYVYMLHYPVAILVLRLLGKNTEQTIYSFWTVFVPTVVVTMVLSVITKVVMNKTVLKRK